MVAGNAWRWIALAIPSFSSQSERVANRGCTEGITLIFFSRLNVSWFQKTRSFKVEIVYTLGEKINWYLKDYVYILCAMRSWKKTLLLLLCYLLMTDVSRCFHVFITIVNFRTQKENTKITHHWSPRVTFCDIFSLYYSFNILHYSYSFVWRKEVQN